MKVDTAESMFMTEQFTDKCMASMKTNNANMSSLRQEVQKMIFLI
jgi:hypothetical protein